MTSIHIKACLTTHSTGAELASLSSRTWMPFDDSSRPVNSSVMSPLRIDSKLNPAAPLVCDCRVEEIIERLVENNGS